MNLSMTIRLAWKNIRGNRLRSGLTVLGLVIGIASVILLVGLANGATSSINDEMSDMGADLISVSIYDSEKGLSVEDVEDMKRLDQVKGVTPYTMISGTVSREGVKIKESSILGTGAEYSDMMGYKLKWGRELSPIDVENSSKAVVIGSKIAKKLWKKENPVGKAIKIDGDEYVVVGVLKSAGSGISFVNANTTVFMPITTAKYLGVDTRITDLYVRAESEEVSEEAAKTIRKYLKNEKNVGKWSSDVYSQKETLEAIEEMNRTLSLLLGGIASISLLVGGIGVMNVMLVSVTERTREIGIRKSLGAKKRDILYQFLIESTVLSVFGGLIGIVVGIGIGKLISIFGIPFLPSIGMILLSFGVSVGVGLLFGILPSYRASCLRPVEALRYE